VVIIDDSIVRGTTSRRLVSILRRAGAKEVHIRICSPPVRFPCFFGIDTPHRKDLISNVNSVDELCKSLGADSLAFISVKGLLESLGSDGEGGYCLGCFTGEYPMPVPGEML
jgi:amidophosphoribosyltransferase